MNISLKATIYPNQVNDYQILQIPDYFKINANEYVPIDIELVNIIKYLWNNKIETVGCDQGYSKNSITYTAFIRIRLDEHSNNFIFNKFNKNDIVCTEEQNNFELLLNKFHFDITKGYLSMMFYHKNINLFYETLIK
jgi:hypothetical protein